ncbi:copper-binding protein [Reyranella sp.]|uniref:copper-binding protein n=1 Tax=Reyranella sp. TaxID=1929291 RepID=UPI003BAA4C69
MSTKSFLLAAALAALALSPSFVSPLSAATLPGVADMDGDTDLQNCTAEAPDDTPLGSGRVVAVDPAAGRITLEYRPLPLLPEGGVRVFAVEDPALLKGLSAGDRVRFDVERDGRRYVLRHLENSN